MNERHIAGAGPAGGDDRQPPERPLPDLARLPVFTVAALLAVVLVATSDRYGYHRDELYFLASGRHLAWGYPDQPLFVPFIARLMSDVASTSLSTTTSRARRSGCAPIYARPGPRSGRRCATSAERPRRSYPRSVRGSPKWGRTPLSRKRVIVETWLPSSVSTMSPWARAIGACGSLT